MKNSKNKGLKSRIFMALVAVSMLLFSSACEERGDKYLCE